MRRQDVMADIRGVVKCGADERDDVAWGESDPAPMVDIDETSCRRGYLVAAEPSVGVRDERPRVRVGRGFAGEVSGVELREGGVDVVHVELDVRRDPAVGVDLNDD